MNFIDYTICSSNLLVIKSRLELLLDKMSKQVNPNQQIIKEFNDSINRVNESYLWFNETKELAFSVNNRNKQLENLLLDFKSYIVDLKKEVNNNIKEVDNREVDMLNNQIEILKEKLSVCHDYDKIVMENIDLRMELNKYNR